MPSNSIKKNTILNLIKTLGAYIFPLLTYPYIFRVLMAEGVGKYNYAYSIVSYFVLVAGLGINTYAIREGAKIRDDSLKIHKFFSEMIGMSTISTLCAYLLFCLFLFFSSSLADYKMIITVLSPIIIATAFNFEWVFTIYEDFLFVTIRTFIINVITLGSVFLLVNGKRDVNIYAAIHSFQLITIMFLNMYYSKKYIQYGISFNIKSHIKPILLLFSMSIAIQIYVNVDTTMLGYYIEDRAVGLYNAANKIYMVLKTVVVAIVTTFTPRLTSHIGIANKNYDLEQYKKYLNMLLRILILITIPLTAGTCVLSEKIIVLLSGNDYLEAKMPLIILALAIPACCISTCINSCVLILNNKEQKTLIATIVAAIINLVLNFYFIPNYYQNGAAITTLIAEILVLILVICFSGEYKEYFDIRNIMIDTIKGIIGASIIILEYIIISRMITNTFITIGLTFFVAVVSYGLFLITTKDELIWMFLKKKGF